MKHHHSTEMSRLNVSLTRLDQQGISVLGAAALAEQPSTVEPPVRREAKGGESR